MGIAPKAKILPVRVLDQENRYDDAMIVAKGVRWAVDHGARVINLSLGGNGSSAALAAALDYAFAKDVVVVACTGNTSASSATEVWYPAREPGVIAVAGMERDGDVALVRFDHRQGDRRRPPRPPSWSAPGRRGYWRVQGTSFAAPMVSGTAALIRSRWPTMPAGEVINRIIRTAKDRGPAGPRRHVRLRHGRPDRRADRRGAGRRPATRWTRRRRRASPGFGSAPAPGQAQSAPDGATDGRWRRGVPGADAGQAAAPAVASHAPAATAATGGHRRGRCSWSRAIAALLTVRRRFCAHDLSGQAQSPVRTPLARLDAGPGAPRPPRWR